MTLNKNKHIFIIGSKGIPANYGGFESFVENLTYYRKDDSIKYYVSCLVDSDKYDDKKGEFIYNNAVCFNIKALNIGSAKAISYDIDAIRFCIKYIKRNKIDNPIIYVLACRIGPFINLYKKEIQKLGGTLYVNPDGHEWKRDKWNSFVKMYWKLSEKLMVKHADLLICDSINIEKYIKKEYKKYKPNTTFIAYGADTIKSKLEDNDSNLLKWYLDKGVREKEYYLAVGRFVPENNFETMIKEFMKSDTDKDFVLITNVEKNTFYDKLKKTTGFENDKRIKFVGTVYDKELLKKIRENAYAYFHGHEVGGTNPSLLEALGSTDLNLLLNVGFNKEVGQKGALYWNKDGNSLRDLIEKADKMSLEEIQEMSKKAKNRIEQKYSWDYIIDKYEKLFTQGC